MEKMEEKKIKRTYKDTVFRKLFSTKENALSLYNAINGTNYGEKDEFKLETLDNAFFADKRDDLAFSINGKLVVFCEAQSTKSPNLPFRMLSYMIRTYERMYNERIFFSRKQYKLIAPEFYLLYNGVEAWDVDELRLSDAFVEKPSENSVELVVKVLNLRYNLYEKEDAHEVTEEEAKALEVLAQSAVTRGYYLLNTYALEGLREGLSRTEAVEAAIDRCIGEGYLVEFLQAEKREVSAMMFDWISNEEYRKIMDEDTREILTEEITEEVTAKVTEEVTKEVTKELTEKFTKEKEAEVAKAAKQAAEHAAKQAAEENLLNNIRTLIATLSLSAEQAMAALKVPPEQQERLLPKLH